jgi:anti-anti-sigma factor
VASADSCSVHVEDGRFVVGGDVDRYSCQPLLDALRDATAIGADVVVDLRQVRFIDSTGMTVLVLANNWAKAGGCRLTILPSAPVERLIAVLRLADVLPVACTPVVSAAAPDG